MKTVTILFLLLFYIILFLLLLSPSPVQTKRSSIKLYCFWTGDNKMSKNRLKAFNTLKKTNLNIILIKPSNLHNYILENHKLHEGYKYLSLTHKADYLRCYFMTFYGGGYSDIKKTNKSWIPSIELINKNKNIYGIGYKEIGKHGVPTICHDIVKNNWKKLIGNGAYILKKNTPFVNEWYNKLLLEMDNNFEQLKKYPGKKPQEIWTKEYPYPFRWSQILGDIFHPLCYKYNVHILQSLPSPSFNNYR